MGSSSAWRRGFAVFGAAVLVVVLGRAVLWRPSPRQSQRRPEAGAGFAGEQEIVPDLVPFAAGSNDDPGAIASWSPVTGGEPQVSHLSVTALVRNRGFDCWRACEGAAGNCEWCGENNACCKKGASEDPPECTGITDFWTDHYECVRPVHLVSVKHWGQECLEERCLQSGDCPWCGEGNACCQRGNLEDAEECLGVITWPDVQHYTCVAPVRKVGVKHAGQDCFDICRGAGYCGWCGEGNACCHYGDEYNPLECQEVVFFPTKEHHTCVKPVNFVLPLAPRTRQAPADLECPVGKVLGRYGCVFPDSPITMTFYLYQLEGDRPLAAESSNLASLGGVMWLLHKSVVGHCPRPSNISKIARWKITVRNTDALYASKSSQFGHFTTFENGKCQGCETDSWKDTGFVVGCKTLDINEAAYTTNPPPALFSFPGPCPYKSYEDVDAGCRSASPGGACPAPTGAPDCTFAAERAGEITLDELSGRDSSESFESWCSKHSEYNTVTDAGAGFSFWNGIHDKELCEERMEKLLFVFEQKYPAVDASALGQPLCDSWA